LPRRDPQQRKPLSIQTTPETERHRSTTSDNGHQSAARRTFTETKNGFKTSEFYVMAVFVAAVLLAAFAADEDALGRDDCWLFASLAVVAYVVSRGLAKVGVREPSGDRDR
jgi:hypothetical protein